MKLLFNQSIGNWYQISKARNGTMGFNSFHFQQWYCCLSRVVFSTEHWTHSMQGQILIYQLASLLLTATLLSPHFKPNSLLWNEFTSPSPLTSPPSHPPPHSAGDSDFVAVLLHQGIILISIMGLPASCVTKKGF